jgi:putative ABC transport system permease protein
MYTLLVSLRLAWATLMLNKLRSLLTLAGMIIGVSAVISIVSLGEGLRADMQESLSSLGADVMFMAPKPVKRPGKAPKQPDLFKMADLEAVEQQCPSVQKIIPGINVDVTAKYRNKEVPANVLGVYEDYLETNDSDRMSTGRFFTRSERIASARVVIIGEDIAKDLFSSGESPLGRYVKLNGINYKIVGQFKKRANTFTGAPNVDDGFAAPIDTVQKRIIGSDDVFWVSIYLVEGASLNEAKEQVSMVMRQRRQIRNASDDDFELMTPEDFAEMGNQFINVMVGIFGAIAFISLLVGGIGIMNIMLVSVTERTREIGLRMALGAGRPTVLTQFLIEAIVLTLLGGIIGLGLGFLSGQGVGLFLSNLTDSPWNPHIPVPWIINAIVVSLLVGVIFGVYPAFKASQLDPVEAMRYE